MPHPVGIGGEVFSVFQFSPDGRRIVTASDDGTARVYRVVAPSDLAKLLGK